MLCQAKCAISLPSTIEMQYSEFGEKQIFICLDGDHLKCITDSDISKEGQTRTMLDAVIAPVIP